MAVGLSHPLFLNLVWSRLCDVKSFPFFSPFVDKHYRWLDNVVSWFLLPPNPSGQMTVISTARWSRPLPESVCLAVLVRAVANMLIMMIYVAERYGQDGSL